MVHISDGEDEHLPSLQDAMLANIQLKRKIENFQNATKHIDKAIEAEDFTEDPESALKKMYEELNANISHDELMQDPNYRKVVDMSTESGQPESNSALETVTEDAEGLVMTQDNDVPFDPLTKLPVTDPVINKICHHTYDKASIMQHIGSRRNQARCPISGCANTQILHAGVLEENVELKRIINRKKAGDTTFFN